MLFISFIFMPAFPLGRVTGATSIGGLGIPDGQQQFQIVLLFLPVHTKTGPSKVGDAVTPPRLWTTSGSLFRGFSQQDWLH